MPTKASGGRQSPEGNLNGVFLGGLTSPARLFLFALAVLVGCGPPEKVPVAGTVTYDGAALPDGDILFFPSNPDHGPEYGKIEQGKFSFLARPGANRVTITASKIIEGGAKGGAGEPVPEDYIPARYNQESKLKADVPEKGALDLKFELTSDK